MKKIYLSASAVLLGFAVMAQSGIEGTTALKTATFTPAASQNHTPVRGATIWSDDFTTASNWSATNAGTPSADWVIGTTAPSGQYSSGMGAITSTSGGNFAMFDSDALGSGTSTQDASVTTAASIDVSAYATASVQFESYYRLFEGQCFVEVSTDGTNFTQFEVHNNMNVNDASANPELITVNVSSVASNQPAVWIRFRYTGAWDYAWMIDDVKLVESDNHDLSIDSYYWGSEGLHYYQIPNTQVAPIDFSMNISNAGAVDQTNVTLTADVNTGAFVGTSAAATVAVGAMDSVFSTTQYTPAAANGTHSFTMTLSADSTDTNPANSPQVSETFDVVDFIYARDNGTIDGRTGGEDGGAPGSFGHEAGNLFDIWA